MLRTRVIPVLLLKNGGLYKGKKFKDHKYVGDPINTVKIFNEKQVDELVILDIEASQKNKLIDYQLIEEVAGEAFMPIAYGGGIKTVKEVQKIFSLGIEKVILNTNAILNPTLVQTLVGKFGSQSIVFSLDTKPNLFKKNEVYIKSGSQKVKGNVIDIAIQMQNLGVGEIFLNCIHKDGTRMGYDLELIKMVSNHIQIPLVSLGGVGSFNHLIEGKKAGAHGLAVGSFFVFHGPHKGVIISYLNQEEIEKINNI